MVEEPESPPRGLEAVGGIGGRRADAVVGHQDLRTGLGCLENLAEPGVDGAVLDQLHLALPDRPEDDRAADPVKVGVGEQPRGVCHPFHTTGTGNVKSPRTVRGLCRVDLRNEGLRQTYIMS